MQPREVEYRLTEKAPRGEGRLTLRVRPSGLKEFYYRNEDASSLPTRRRAAQYPGRRAEECEKAAQNLILHPTCLRHDTDENIQRMPLNELLTVRIPAAGCATICHIMRRFASVCTQAEGAAVLSECLLSATGPSSLRSACSKPDIEVSRRLLGGTGAEGLTYCAASSARVVCQSLSAMSALCVCAPDENQKDLVEIPDNIKGNLETRLVSDGSGR